MNYEYSVKRIEVDVYRIYKFEEGDSHPTTNYTMTTYDSKFKCACPSGKYRGYCKHNDMVKAYRKLERQWSDKLITEIPMITFRYK